MHLPHSLQSGLFRLFPQKRIPFDSCPPCLLEGSLPRRSFFVSHLGHTGMSHRRHYKENQKEQVLPGDNSSLHWNPVLEKFNRLYLR